MISTSKIILQLALQKDIKMCSKASPGQTTPHKIVSEASIFHEFRLLYEARCGVNGS